MKTAIIIFIVLAALAAVYFFFFHNKKQTAGALEGPKTTLDDLFTNYGPSKN